MEAARQLQLTREIFELVDNETTEMAPASYANDVDTYVNPGQARREVEELFLNRPLNLAMSADLPNAGDCLSVDHLPVPVLLRALRKPRRRRRTLRCCKCSDVHPPSTFSAVAFFFNFSLIDTQI